MPRMYRHRFVGLIRARLLIAAFCSAALYALCLSSQAQEIVSFESSVIVWTNAYADGVYTVEWASDLAGTWRSDWNGLESEPIVGSVMTTAVPRFYRVRNGSVWLDWLDWVPVSNAHNAADSTGYGAVNYDFRISKYEINNSEYVQFLNTVDPTGSNALWLYSSQMASSPRGGISNNPAGSDGAHYVVRYRMFNKPVTFVSFWDAARFVNWLHNGRGNGGTGSGVYDLYAINPDNASISRSPGARYFIPNENEWYKAAYYEQYEDTYRYWVYSARADSAPTVAEAAPWGGIINDTNNIANYDMGAVWNGVVGNVTGVGSGGPGSESFYGAADMAGNVYEWNEAILSVGTRGVRGGCWYSPAGFLQKTARHGYTASYEFDSVGFRVGATIPAESAAGAAVEGPGSGGGDDDIWYPPPPG